MQNHLKERNTIHAKPAIQYILGTSNSTQFSLDLMAICCVSCIELNSVPGFEFCYVSCKVCMLDAIAMAILSAKLQSPGKVAGLFKKLKLALTLFRSTWGTIC